MNDSKMKVLVLGGGGFIGSHLVNALKEIYSVTVFERRRSEIKVQGVDYIYGDFEQEDVLRKSLLGIDLVVHLISTTVPKTADADPVYDLNTNLMNTVNLLKILPETNVKKIVYFSSGGTVYGEPKSDLICEDHAREPIGSYGIVKCAIEDYVKFFASKNDFEYLIIRPSNPYGPGQNTYGLQGVIPIIFDSIINDSTFNLWGGGLQVRDYVYIDDLVEAVSSLLKSDCVGAFNIGSGVGFNVVDLVEMVENKVGKKLRTKTLKIDHFAIERVVLSIEKIKTQTGWTPSVSLSEGLTKYYSWLKQV